MKKLIFISIVTFMVAAASAQQVVQVSLSNSNADAVYSFLVDGNVQVNVNKDGKILEWGTEMQQGHMSWYPGKLEPFMGRVEYYGPADNEAFRGKPRSIGSAAITYYSSYENEAFAGKVKSIGATAVDYYNTYDNEAFRGKLKTAGTLSFSYYAEYDNAAYKGKLKSVGNTAITYYSSNDDKAYKGKLKSIGSTTYTYYSSFDQVEYRGVMKTGSQLLMMNSINYIIRY